MTRSLDRRGLPLAFFGALGALAIGLASSHLAPLAIGLATLAPLISHARWVGVRRAISEPSAITIIVGFYLFIFPLRGLVIAARGYTDVNLVHDAVSGTQLAVALLLASLGTTVLIEAFYFMRGPQPVGRRPRYETNVRHPRDGVLALASILGFIAVAAFTGMLVHYGGFQGVKDALQSHSKESLLEGERPLPVSVWWIMAVPAVWCAAYVAVDSIYDALVRWAFGGLGVLIILAELLVLGSRLSAIQALIGVWIVLYYSGRPIPVRAIVAAIPAAILLSVPIVSERPGGSDAGLPAIERYSRIAGYGVLDASLAVRQQPAEIRDKMEDPRRWLDTPGYLAPSAGWPDKPNLDTRRLDLYVAQTLGDQNQQTTGFPTTYVTEGWLYGGWPGVVILSVLFGGLLGWLHRRLIGPPPRGPSPAALLSYAFLATIAFGFYKDGDLLLNIVGNVRAVVYLGALLLFTGVWAPFRRASPAAYAVGWSPVAAPATQPLVPASPGEDLMPRVDDSPGALLYVMSEHPSVSETFIVNEAAAVAAFGMPVVGYALRRGAAVRSAADIELICPPPTRVQLFAGAAGSLPAYGRELWRSRGARLEPRERARLLLALAHASYAAPRIQDHKVTHIHAHFLGRSADVASLLAPRLGCAWTATAHGQDVYAPVEPGLLRRRVRTVAAVACANGGLQRKLLEAFGPAAPRTKVVHCGVDTASLAYSADRSLEPPHLVTVGRLVATKGHWTVLEAATDLMRANTALRWTIAGDGPLHDQLTRDPRVRELAPRLMFTGALDHASTLELVDRASAFVLPCEVGEAGESDGIPVALMEAMALGVPVITTPIAGIPELVQHHETGFLVPPRDAARLVEMIGELLYRTSSADLRRIRDTARERIDAEFDLRTEARSLLAMLDAYIPAPRGMRT